jgi:hypothetical protein
MTGGVAVFQRIVAAVFLGLGLLGGYVHWRRDRRSFWYFGTFMVTLTLVLIYYLNFKYGHSQCLTMENQADVACEVRDRDYFFIVSFSAWGVWAGLGLMYLWETLATLFGAERVRVGRETIELPRRRSWLFATPVLALALIPLIGNWRAASRAGHTDTRDFAHDLLNSVEPYGVLVTVGDNDTFPLWYAQEVEGIRKDVVVANTSLLNTDWYTRQLIRRPVFEYDAAKGPAIYRGRAWAKPSGPPLKLTMQEADAVPSYMEIRQPQVFRKGNIVATLRPPQVLNRADLLVLRMILDGYPERPMYFSKTAGSYGRELGLDPFLIQQGLARKLLPDVPQPSADTVLLPGEGWIDVARTRALWDSVFVAPRSIIRRGQWVDKASVGIPYLYISSAISLYEAEQRSRGAASEQLLTTAEAIARATGLEQLFAPTAFTRQQQPELGDQPGQAIPVTPSSDPPRKRQ